MKRLLLASTLFASSVTLFAQGPTLVCDGRRATVRVSDITATGTAKAFMDAVAAHRAWLASHGLSKDEVITVPVIVRDEQTRVRSYSDKQFWSIHIHGSKDPEPKHDEAYDAFVKTYRDNSNVKSAYNICLPSSSLK